MSVASPSAAVAADLNPRYGAGRAWQARWITRRSAPLGSWYGAPQPAPLLRRDFTLPGAVQRATLWICGLGYYEARLNGRRVGDHVLDPIVTQYDRRARYLRHDVTALLQPGANAIGVTLGAGWYNCHTAEVWHFDKASWRDYPKLLCELDVTLASGATWTLGSDRTWRCATGPLVFDGLRNGETYDARLEVPGWDQPGFDDSAWTPAMACAGPGGVLEEQTSPPCRVMTRVPTLTVTPLGAGKALFDLGQNIAGWARLRLSGPAGTEITLRYAERLDADGQLDAKHIGCFVKSGDFQTDRYILKGEGEESWAPQFTYHGFRWVEVSGLPGEATRRMITGEVVRTSFAEAGRFESSDQTLNALQTCTRWAFIGNFVGIPTDCPHREKNGWTGDAQLAAETGLWNYQAAGSYAQWLDTMADTQRPSGQFPGIVPSAGWGYNWGSGPAWDSAYILIPWYMYLFTGELDTARKHLDGMCRYLDYCADMSDGHIADFGLGDWCSVKGKKPASSALTSSGYVYVCARTVARFAALLGQDAEASARREQAAAIRSAVNATFYRGDGLYDDGAPTALACAVYQGLVADSERAATVARLAAHIAALDAKADFGILGAKYIPRVLAEHGHLALAYRLITQPEQPGWAWWLSQGATTLWEDWYGETSRNHIMFGDISAWMYQYLAGIAPDPERPGFAHLHLAPRTVPGLGWVKARHLSPHGRIGSEWHHEADGSVVYTLIVPDGVTADLSLADGTREHLAGGTHTFTHPA